MINLEYFNGKEWVPAGGPFGNEMTAWISLGGDDRNYRTVDKTTGKVLTDKSVSATSVACAGCGKNVAVDWEDFEVDLLCQACNVEINEQGGSW